MDDAGGAQPHRCGRRLPSRQRLPYPRPRALFTAAFRRLLADAGVEVVRLPARSPNLNAYAERFVRSVRDDRLNHIVPPSEPHLRRVLREYLEHYHLERNHQGLDNALIQARAGPANDNGEVLRKQRLGGLLNFYERRAA